MRYRRRRKTRPDDSETRKKNAARQGSGIGPITAEKQGALLLKNAEDIIAKTSSRRITKATVPFPPRSVPVRCVPSRLINRSGVRSRFSPRTKGDRGAENRRRRLRTGRGSTNFILRHHGLSMSRTVLRNLSQGRRIQRRHRRIREVRRRSTQRGKSAGFQITNTTQGRRNQVRQGWKRMLRVEDAQSQSFGR